MADKLVIVDGNAILHRAFHALPPLTNRKGEPINAVYGLVSMLLKVITDLKPTHIAVAFDEKAPTFRQKELPTYQAQRPPMAKELGSQFVKARDFLKAADIPVFSKPGFEADDVIGTIATKAKEDVVIVTGDRDQLQLVDDKKPIKLYMPIAGLINAKLFGEAETTERMGVPPTQILTLKP
jgi:DNA polymerase-1